MPDEPSSAGAPLFPVSLYLRADGSLMLVREEQAIEIPLTPAQMLQLGVDALRLAVALQPSLAAEAVHALENTYIVPLGADQCQTLN